MLYVHAVHTSALTTTTNSLGAMDSRDLPSIDGLPVIGSVVCTNASAAILYILPYCCAQPASSHPGKGTNGRCCIAITEVRGCCWDQSRRPVRFPPTRQQILLTYILHSYTSTRQCSPSLQRRGDHYHPYICAAMPLWSAAALGLVIAEIVYGQQLTLNSPVSGERATVARGVTLPCFVSFMVFHKTDCTSQSWLYAVSHQQWAGQPKLGRSHS